MMNIEKADKKQIEEMAQIINGSTELDTIAYYRCMNIAKTLYNAGYRKPSEDSVVLTMKEWENLHTNVWRLTGIQYILPKKPFRRIIWKAKK